MKTEDMTMAEWLDLGIEMGWCSAPYCQHGGQIPVTPEEKEASDADPEYCLWSVRVSELDDSDKVTTEVVH